MRRIFPMSVLLVAALLAGCGIPREAGQLASLRAAGRPVELTDDAAVRAALAAEADDWTHLSALLLRSELGGIQANPASAGRFTSLVIQTAALARRQRDLIAAGEDDPALNRRVLEQLDDLWRQADEYLNPR